MARRRMTEDGERSLAAFEFEGEMPVEAGLNAAARDAEMLADAPASGDDALWAELAKVDAARPETDENSDEQLADNAKERTAALVRRHDWNATEVPHALDTAMGNSRVVVHNPPVGAVIVTPDKGERLLPPDDPAQSLPEGTVITKSQDGTLCSGRLPISFEKAKPVTGPAFWPVASALAKQAFDAQ